MRREGETDEKIMPDNDTGFGFRYGVLVTSSPRSDK